MANETRGILYETITDAAINRAIKLARVKGQVFWNEKPEKMSIMPDFIIGENVNEPTHVLLITASGATHNSHMKSWRNLAELQEVKAQLPLIPLVINIYFKSEVKEGISAASEYCYDTIFHVDKKPYYKTLESWVNANLHASVKTKEKRREILQRDLAANPTLASAIDKLTKDLAETLNLRKDELDPLWQLMKIDYAKTHVYPTVKTSALRRGLGKLSVIEPQYRQLIYDAEKKRGAILTAKLPQYVFDLNFFNRSIAGSRLSDNEIKYVINLLGSNECEDLLKKVNSSMQGWIEELQQLQNIHGFLAFVIDKFDSLINPKVLSIALKECQKNPNNFAIKSNLEFKGHLLRNWLFLVLMDIIKASTGKLTGFGYAQLSSTLESTADVSSGYITIADWANCVPDTQLPNNVIDNVAVVLSKKLQEIGKDKLNKIGDFLIKVTEKSILQDRLLPYRNFEPLLWLLEEELVKHRKNYGEKTTYIGWLNEYSQMGKRVATTPFVKVGNTLIHWKSSYGSHTTDKTKELSARARNVKYQYNPSTHVFSRRKGIEKLAIILDGDWTEKNLQTLTEAGWDLIVYPDEISDLVSKL